MASSGWDAPASRSSCWASPRSSRARTGSTRSGRGSSRSPITACAAGPAPGCAPTGWMRRIRRQPGSPRPVGRRTSRSRCVPPSRRPAPPAPDRLSHACSPYARQRRRLPVGRRRRCRAVLSRWVLVRSGGRALLADDEGALDVVDPAAVLHEEAARAGELIGLAGKDPHGELLAGEIGTGELIGIGRFGLILIDRRGGGLVATTLQLLDRVFAGVVVVLARGVVISGHLRSVPGLVGVVRPGCSGSY